MIIPAKYLLSSLGCNKMQYTQYLEAVICYAFCIISDTSVLSPVQFVRCCGSCVDTDWLCIWCVQKFALDIISQTHEQWQRLVLKQADAGSLKWYVSQQE